GGRPPPADRPDHRRGRRRAPRQGGRAPADLGRPLPDGLAGGGSRRAAEGGGLRSGRPCPGKQPAATDQAGAVMSGNKREQGEEACGVGLCTEELINSSDAPGRTTGRRAPSPAANPPASGPTGRAACGSRGTTSYKPQVKGDSWVRSNIDFSSQHP